MFGLTVDTDADGKFYSAIARFFKKGEESVTGWVFGLIALTFGVYCEPVDFALVHDDGFNVFFFKLVRLVWEPFYHFDPLFPIKRYLSRLKEDLGEEILSL